MATPRTSVGIAATTKPHRQASSPPMSDTSPPTASGATNAPALPATSLTAYTRARAEIGYASAMIALCTGIVFERPRAIAHRAMKYQNAVVTNPIIRATTDQKMVATPTMWLRFPLSASRAITNPPPTVNSAEPAVRVAITASLTSSVSWMSGTSRFVALASSASMASSAPRSAMVPTPPAATASLSERSSSPTPGSSSSASSGGPSAAATARSSSAARIRSLSEVGVGSSAIVGLRELGGIAPNQHPHLVEYGLAAGALSGGGDSHERLGEPHHDRRDGGQPLAPQVGEAPRQ